jgi:pseudouridine 5'-phosphatase
VPPFSNGRSDHATLFKDGRACAQKMLLAFPDLPLTVDGLLAQTDASQIRLYHLAKPLPGAVKLVRHLHAHGIPVAVATSSRRFFFLAKVDHSPDLFACFDDRAVCGDDPGIVAVKPAPDLFLAAAREKLGFDVGTPGETCTRAQITARSKGLVFEDAVVGLQAAKRAGMSGDRRSLAVDRLMKADYHL